MRIACVANINNMMFILCRYLRDEGYDAELITLADEPPHFRPDADAYEDDYLTYYSVLPYSKSTIYSKEAVAHITEKLVPFDFYIGSDIAPALLALIGKKLDVFIPHGSDIYAFPFKINRPSKTDKVWWLREKTTLRKLQKIGIEQTTTILFPDEYDIHFPFKNKLKTNAEYHNTSGPMVYIPQYEGITESEIVKSLPNYSKFKEIRAANELLIFSHSRHNGFDLPAELAIHQKGNDILIKGFAQFLGNHNDLKACLILFDYGMNVTASKVLIKELKIDAHVVWMSLMQRKEIMLGLNMADISCGQFDNSWLTCGVVNETLASNIPLLHYRDDALYTADYESLYPILNVKNDMDIATALTHFMSKKEEYNLAAKGGSEWLYHYTVNNPIQIIKKTINAKPVNSNDLPSIVKNQANRIVQQHRIKDKQLRIIAKLKNYFN